MVIVHAPNRHLLRNEYFQQLDEREQGTDVHELLTSSHIDLRLRHAKHIITHFMQLEAQLKQKTVQMDNLDSSLIATKRELAQQRRDRETAEQVRYSTGKS